MAAFNYKETRTRKMSLKGDLDVACMTIDVDGISMKLQTLLKDFDGLYVDISIGVKSDDELDMPEEEIDD